MGFNEAQALQLQWNQSWILSPGSPGFSWKDQLLIKASEANAVISLDSLPESSVQNLLLSFFPEFPVTLLAELATHPLFKSLVTPDFLTKLRLRDQEQCTLILDLVRGLPVSAMQWLHQKKVRVQDLQFWPGLKEVDAVGVWSWISRHDLTKSEGLQLAERAMECLAMGRNLSDVLTQDNFADAWKALQTIRYPQTSLRDEARQNQNIPWPQSMKARWQRRGDKSGYELSIFVCHPSELEKQVRQLENVVKQWHP